MGTSVGEQIVPDFDYAISIQWRIVVAAVVGFIIGLVIGAFGVYQIAARWPSTLNLPAAQVAVKSHKDKHP